jgi:hypothetical protein
MKKVALFCTFLALILTAGCQREFGGISPAEQDAVVPAESFLVFDTRTDYDSALVNRRKLTNVPAGFVSLASKQANVKQGVGTDKIPDELARLLNSEGVLQIGNWIIKLNFEDRLARVISQDQKKNVYSKLLKEQKDKDIYIFSFEDEVLTLLDEGITISPTLDSNSKKLANARTTFCIGGGGISSNDGGIRQNAHSTCTGNSPISLNPNTARYVRGTDYKKYAVYFRLDAVIWAWVTPSIPFSTVFDACLTNGTFTSNIYWRTNCNTDSGTWPSNPNISYNYNLQYQGVVGAELLYTQEWQVYGGGRGLRCLRVSDFSIINQNAPWIGGSSNFSGQCS